MLLAMCCPVHIAQCPAHQSECTAIARNYQLLEEDNSYSKQLEFYNSFPVDYKRFIHCFGYKKQVGNKGIYFGCLYDNYVDYIGRLFNLNKIDKKFLYRKIITVTYNAYYQDDACSFLQDKIVELIKIDNRFVIFLKSNRNKSWQIYHFIMLNQGKNAELEFYLRNKILK